MSLAYDRSIIHHHYFPHIDGLRSLAVLPVLLFHLLAGACPGGYLGVDVFFVISGYLITGGILRDLQKDRFSLSDFYMRRIKRIMPAYFALVIAVLIMTVASSYLNRVLEVAETVGFSALFSTNIYFWINTNYFAPSAEENPLLNLWSLGVEEQFYMIIPALMLGIYCWRKKSVVPVLLLLFFASLYLNISSFRAGNTDSAFYMLPHRAWELLAGSLLALLPAPNLREPNQTFFITFDKLSFSLASLRETGRILSSTLIGIALLTLGLSYAYVSHETFTPLKTLPIIIGSALLIRYGSWGIFHQFLANPLIVGIGKISYSLYLWHWPVMVFWRSYAPELQWYDYTGMIMSSFLLAYLSWRWIELPFRLAQWKKRSYFISTAVVCALLITASALIRFNPNIQNEFLKSNPWGVTSFSLNMPEEKKILLPKNIIEQSPHDYIDDWANRKLLRMGDPNITPNFIVIGDSHALRFAMALDTLGKTSGFAGFYMSGQNRPLSGVDEYRGNNLITPAYKGSISEELMHWITKQDQIQTVVFHCFWRCRSGRDTEVLKRSNANNTESEQTDLFYSGMKKTCDILRAAGKNTLVIGGVPTYKQNMLTVGQKNPLGNYENLRDKEAPNNSSEKILLQLQNEGSIDYIPIAQFLYNGAYYVISDGIRPYYRDFHHLTEEAYLMILKQIDEKLRKTLKPHPPNLKN